MIAPQDLDHILGKTESLWPCFRGATVFLTGGTGFVGAWLTQTFLHANRELNLEGRLQVLVRNPAAFPHSHDLTILAGDLNTPVFPVTPVDYIIHAAFDHQAATAEANVAALQRIIALAKRVNVKRLLFISSGAVYGEQPADVDFLPEDFVGAIASNDQYALAKRESESALISAASDGLPVSIARLFSFSGPYLPLHLNFAIGNFVRDALAGGPIKIAGDGTPLRSYLYAADMAAWLWTILARGQDARTYNVGSSIPVSILDLARLVERVSAGKSGIRVAQSPIPAMPPKRYLPSIRRAHTELGLEPWIALEDGIERMYHWWRLRNYASTK